MKTRKKASCEYGTCRLPENNNVYLAHAAYGLISFILLASDSSNFNLMNILLFTMPFLIDLLYNKSSLIWVEVIRYAFIAMDFSLAVFSFVGLKLVTESSTIFTIVEQSMILPNLSVSKSHILYLCAINIFVPIFLYNSVPCKRACNTLNETDNIIKNRKESQPTKEEVSVCD